MAAACVALGRGGASGRARVPGGRGLGALPTSAVLAASAAFAPPRPNQRMMGTPSARRGLEWLLGLYFLSHIPITLLFDLQAVLPRELYPVEVRAPVGPGRGSPNAGPPPARGGVPTAPLPALGPRGGVFVLSPRPSCRRCGLNLLFSPTSPSGSSLSPPDPPTGAGANAVLAETVIPGRV